MSITAAPPQRPPANATDARVGVLVTNLGTPEAPTSRAVRRYLAEFLSDRRVVELPPLLWQPILRGIILRVRPRRSAALYRRIWTDQGSPLLAISRRQRQALEQLLAGQYPCDTPVVLGMRYGRPAIGEALMTLQMSGVNRLLILPLYPQYSATTTASTFDAVVAVLKTWRVIPELRFINDYHDEPQYIEALVATVQAAWKTHTPAERLLFSFHGLPERYVQAGDPYRDRCETTARLVAERLQCPADRWAVAFQSRIGREPWLQPYTDQLLSQWGSTGVASVEVICPGFAADCLETLEEIAETDRQIFLSAGGKAFRYLPALNDRPDHIRALADRVLRATADWRQEPASSVSPDPDIVATRGFGPRSRQ
ncbi:MAG: ferrochelatase [Gammaproteobacteria bacterium]